MIQTWNLIQKYFLFLIFRLVDVAMVKTPETQKRNDDCDNTTSNAVIGTLIIKTRSLNTRLDYFTPAGKKPDTVIKL